MYTLENLQILKVPINGDSIKWHKEYESRPDRTVQNVHLNDAYWQQSCLYNSINNSIYLIRVKALIIFIYKYINASFNQPLTFEASGLFFQFLLLFYVLSLIHSYLFFTTCETLNLITKSKLNLQINARIKTFFFQ